MNEMNLNRDLSENVKLNISGVSSSKKSIKNSSIEKKTRGKDSGKRSKKSNRVSKEIEIKNKGIKVIESPVRSGKKKRSPGIQKYTEDSPIQEDSSKEHHEIVSLISNPNMLFNDASSIKYSADNQNMSNFSIPSLAGEGSKARFDSLDGMCYDLISAFVGDKLPSFIFVNKKV